MLILVLQLCVYTCVFPVHVQVDTQACGNACAHVHVVGVCMCCWSAHVRGHMLARVVQAWMFALRGV